LPILPIDTGRYATPEMNKIFEEEARLQKLLDVEAALVWALAEVGICPRKDAEIIAKKASTRYVKLKRVEEIEKATNHDIMAMVNALSEVCEGAGSYIHYGATSSDMLDTATALQFKEALTVIEAKLNRLEAQLMSFSNRYKRTIMIGRTHGQHALPITFGLKTAVWMREISRHIQRLEQCKERVLVGKVTGAVGTQAGLGPKGLQIQKLAMKKLNLKPVEVSTQVIQRDRHAELMLNLALIASSLGKFAEEIRLLQRTEVGEISEFFDVKRQVGSSTMPHKVNPITSERICGIAKLMRSLSLVALENIPSWHERDLTNSSAERFLFPCTFILLDYMLALMNKIFSRLKVNKEQMAENLRATKGRVMSESVMLSLTRKGLTRQEAHNAVRSLALKSLKEGKDFQEILRKDKNARKLLTAGDLNRALDPRSYLGTTIKQIEAAIKQTRIERSRRKLAS